MDFRINGLGTCKHVEAVLLQFQARQRLFRAAEANGTTRIDRSRSGEHSFRLLNARSPPRRLRAWFIRTAPSTKARPRKPSKRSSSCRRRGPAFRLSQELEPWLEGRRHTTERKQLRREYELKVQSGEWPAHETKVPLFPYQREGMLHLAFTERALLADEMGLGKTIQAITACALLHRLGQAARALVVTPASLKTEWEDQIQQFTELPYRLVFGAVEALRLRPLLRTRASVPPRRSSPSSITSRCLPTPWK